MNILLSAYACEPGKGSEPGVGWHWALEITALGHSVWMLTRSNNRSNVEAGLLQHPGLAITPVYYDLPRWAAWWKLGGRGIQLYYVLWQAGAFLLARRLVKKVKFDLVHHIAFGVFRLPSFMGELGLPFVLGPIGGGEMTPKTLQKDLPLRGQITDRLRSLGNRLALDNPLVHRMLAKSSLILCKTPETLQCLPREFHTKCRIHAEVGIDAPWIIQSRQWSQPPRFLTVSRLLYWKGIHLALDAFAITRKTSTSATLTIVGQGPDKVWLQQRALTVGVSDAVKWLDWMPQEQLKSVYRGHTAMVFPSLHDSSGNVVLEAMASGVPMICLNTGGPGAIVPDDAGIKIDVNLRSQAEIVEELARAMLLVGEDEETAERLSKNAISFARKNSWHDVVERAYSYPEIVRVDPGRHNDPSNTGRDIRDSDGSSQPGIWELLERGRSCELPSEALHSQSNFLDVIYTQDAQDSAAVRLNILYANGNPRWIVDERALQGAYGVFRAWRPYTWKAKAAWSGVQLAARTGWLRLVPGVRAHFISKTSSTIAARLFPQLAGSWPVVYVGGSGMTRKLVIFMCSPNGEVQGIVKLPLTPQARTSILHEARVLRELGARLEGIPSVLGVNYEAGASLQSCIDGAPAGREFTAAHVRLLLSLPPRTSHASVRGKVESLRATIEANGFGHLLQRFHNLLNCDEGRCSVWEHGDFAPWNMKLLSRGDLTILDWEYADPDGLPLLDICHWFYRQGYLFQDIGDPFAAILSSADVREYRAALKISVHETQSLAALYLVRSLLYRVADIRRNETYLQFVEKALASIEHRRLDTAAIRPVSRSPKTRACLN